ncbi:hypothetical protein BGP75_05215 [Motiliproteus sp. MSK22-1]|nr:hypothetical protein BGP75_05215 [Motiliproteus sp. MSK22-1]
MSIERAILIFAGSMILISLILTWWVHIYWAGFTLFIALNMIQSAFTGFCPAALVMRRFGLRSESELSIKQYNSLKSGIANN